LLDKIYFQQTHAGILYYFILLQMLNDVIPHDQLNTPYINLL